MVKLPPLDRVGYLVRHRFPNAVPPSSFSRHDEIRNYRAPTATERQSIAEYEAELRRVADGELEERYRAARDEEAARRRSEEEARLPFNRPSAAADFDHWALMDVWSLEEATALTLGRDPPKVNWETVKAHRLTSDFAARYERRRQVLQRVGEIQAGNGFTTPDKIAHWAVRSGADVPAQLLNAISKRPPPLTTTTSDIETLRRMLADKDDEIASLKNELEALLNRPIRDLMTRERSTCLKLIAGMAVKGYGYEPKAPRSDKPSEITGDLHVLGIEIDVDTVRKWLKDATELLDDR